ncbi:TonB-dependent receptor, partial [bacterium]|nr:TonB-dependent receptor [candidate division CSSED10-310 bacterium]
VTVLTREMIELMGMRNLTEVLRYVVGSAIIGTPISPSGLVHYDTKNLRVLILIDGRPANDVYLGSFYAAYFFKLENVKRIEIIHTPGSPLYGANALGGVINIVTRLEDEEAGVSTKLVASSNPLLEMGMRTQGRYGAFDGTMAFSWSQDSGANGLDNNNDRQLMDFFTKWRMEESGLSITAGSMTIEHGLPLGEQWRTEWDRAETRQHFLDVQMGSISLFGGRLSLRSYMNLKNTTYLAYINLPPSREDPVHHQYEEKRSSFEALYSHVLTSWNTTSVGFEYTNDATDVMNEDSEYDYWTFSMFLQSENKVTDSMVFNVSARQDWTEDFGEFFTPGLSLIYHFNGISYAKLGYSRGYRLPNDFERFLDLEFLHTRVAGNPDLKPERGETYELGFFQRLLAYNLVSTVNVYISDIEDYIITTPSQQEMAYIPENRNRTKIYGVELEARREFKPAFMPGSLVAFCNYTFQKPDSLTADKTGARVSVEEKEYLYYYPRNLLNLGATYLPSESWRLFAGWRWVDSQKTPLTVDPLSRSIESYWVMDLNAGYRFTDRISLDLGIYNVFDKRYWELVDFPGPRRQLQVTFSYRWNH